MSEQYMKPVAWKWEDDGDGYSKRVYNINPDVIAAHAQFGGDLELMQKAYEHPDLVAEINRLRAALSSERKRALESAANVASMWASRTATEANALRKLRDYARAKQLASEAEGATRIAAAIRSLMEKPE